MEREIQPIPLHSRLEGLEIPKSEEQEVEKESSFFESLSHVAETTLLYAKMIPYFFSFLKGLVMKDWKTTSTAVVGAIAHLINYFTGFIVPIEIINAVVLTIGLVLAKDGVEK